MIFYAIIGTGNPGMQPSDSNILVPRIIDKVIPV